jgi:hypothetical protein
VPATGQQIRKTKSLKAEILQRKRTRARGFMEFAKNGSFTGHLLVT